MALAGLALCFPQLVEAIDRTVYLKLSGAGLATGEGVGIRDQGTVAGIRGNEYLPSLGVQFRYRFEGKFDWSAGADGHDDHAELKVGRMGVGGGFGRVDGAVRQWSPYYNFLRQFTHVFSLRNALQLFEGYGCLAPIGRSFDCARDERIDDVRTDVDYERPTWSVAYTTPKAYASTESRPLGPESIEAQVLVGEDITSIGAGFVTPGLRYNQPWQEFGAAIAGIADRNGAAYSIGLTGGGLHQQGYALGGTYERFRTSSGERGHSLKLTAVLHDLARFRSADPAPRTPSLLHSVLVRSSLRFGYNGRWLSGVPTRRWTDAYELYAGVRYDHSPFTRISLEGVHRDAGDTDFTVGLLFETKMDL